MQCDGQYEVQRAPPSVALAIAKDAVETVHCWRPILHSIGIAVAYIAVATATVKTTKSSKNATRDAGLALAREQSRTRR